MSDEIPAAGATKGAVQASPQVASPPIEPAFAEPATAGEGRPAPASVAVAEAGKPAAAGLPAAQTTAQAGKRVFLYDGKKWDDPDPNCTIEDVRNALVGAFPELAEAEFEEKTLEDGTREITFRKVAGRKGTEPS